MKLTIEIKHRPGGDMEVRIHRHAGMSSDDESAFADAITEVVKKAIPDIGHKVFGKGSTTSSGRGFPPTN